ncbi:DUF4389 domain-containing protein [Umezawaea endophytica]|uniref:DUF4389 domain-containing protein n=1 Tax=Umezawaea endophytica TaxID=1654476 RepID=A0A9X3AJL8_9PSEU|nr:DUF4389 domain-containing protein [Umezawaea endophytica]MCS7484757.1 DUF4389 domain-containing protein [Umezawaea endophytica]
MTTAAARYPVRVRGRLDPGLSRWLWLVKWLLAIPHYVVLAFLWAGFAACTVLAFFGILFAGRYPRPLFDFTLGVLRWTWRVAYYTYGALGTDQYPPFSLGPEPNYPAALDIAYPEHLSRGLVLVKWWLLAIPHYLVVGIFLGGGGYAASQAGQWAYSAGGGLVGLVALFAGVALLVTGRYPRGLFDFLLGMDRWALRVAAYAGLMTDAYPPFRLDTGGDEPGVTTIDQEPPPPPSSGWTGGRVAAVVIGALLLGTGSLVSAAGAIGLWAHSTQRDADGYLVAGTKSFHSSGYALSFGAIDLRWTEARWRIAEDWLGEVRLRADDDVVVGIGPADDVARYLEGVEHDEVWPAGAEVDYRHQAGGPLPVAQPAWAASGTGSLTWRAEQGTWAVVARNADNGKVVDTELSARATVPALGPVSTGALLGGVLLVSLGGTMLLIAAMHAFERRRTTSPEAVDSEQSSED